MRCAYKKNILCCGILIIILIIFLHPDMNAKRTYFYIEKEDIVTNLLEKTVENFSSNAIVRCEYRDAVFDESTLSVSLMDGDLIEGHRIKEGGEYIPSECKPKFSSAIIVPYRDRAEQLRGFLVYMHMFLRRQCIHYRIYVVEQLDSKLFNRAKLLNIGATVAMQAGYPCLILHNVDLLPLRPGNMYACTKQPRHMSSNVNQFRFVLPYPNVFGGAVAIASDQYKHINGMSNKYFGNGGEDDDLYARLEARGLKVCRFEPHRSRYHMFHHPNDYRGDGNQKLLKHAKERMTTDGLNSLKYTEIATVLHPLFTHIMVDL